MKRLSTCIALVILVGLFITSQAISAEDTSSQRGTPSTANKQMEPAPGASQSSAPRSSEQATQQSETNREKEIVQQGRTSKLIGASLVDNQDKKVGKVYELIMGKDGRISYAIIEHGGFL